MGYRIRMVPEVAGWLGQLRDADPGIAGSAPSSPTASARLSLSELRPAAPVRILFTMEPSSSGAEPSGTAVLLAAGTERDWLDAWYAEAIRQSRTRYGRDQGATG
jgi:hypothetical protein